VRTALGPLHEIGENTPLRRSKVAGARPKNLDSTPPPHMSSLLDPVPGTRRRPELRNIHVTQILGYRLPLPGLVSIMHRVSGALLFLSAPFLLWLFELSLTSEGTWARLQGFAGGIAARLLLLVLAWAVLHHAVAGLRYLALDLHLGVDKGAARRSALIVYAVSLPLTLIAALRLFGVF